MTQQLRLRPRADEVPESLLQVRSERCEYHPGDERRVSWLRLNNPEIRLRVHDKSFCRHAVLACIVTSADSFMPRLDNVTYSWPQNARVPAKIFAPFG